MKHKYPFYLFVILFFSIGSALADVWTTAIITENTTWTKANGTGDGVYVVDLTVDTLVVQPGVTLTIEPGVTVKMHDDIRFLVYGSMDAEGTATDSIIFTLDDASGSATEWGGIKLIPTDTTYSSNLSFCHIENGDADGTSLSDPDYKKSGGAIFFGENTTSLTSLSHAIIQNNHAIEGGGGIGIAGSPSINNCLVRNNSTDQYGGGISLKGPSPLVIASPNMANMLVYHNTTGGSGGGGIGLFSGALLNMSNSLIYSNTSPNGSGGGLYLYSATTVANVVNSVIGDNTANSDAQVSGGANITYSDVQDGASGEGNIDQDPEFIDAANNDFHFKANSPVVDKGSNGEATATDFDGNDRPFDGDRDGTGTVDMGPYEYQNTAPQITSTAVTSATEDQLYSYQVTVSDPDTNEVLSYALTEYPSFLSIEPSTGLISGTPSTDEQAGDYTVTVQVADLNNATDTQTYTLTVTAVNDAPVVSGIPDQTINEGESFVTIALDDYVTDEDNSDTEMSWAYSGNAQLAVSIDANRVATITIPNSDWYGNESITFTATDPGGLSGSDAASFTVTNVNDAPVLSDIPDQTIDEGSTFATISLDDYVTDIDNVKEDLTWTYSGNSELSVSIDANRVATVSIPDTNWFGTETITFTVTDPGGLFDSDRATFTVNAVNDAPVVSDIPDQTIDEGQSFVSIDLDAYASDVDNADSELSWTYSGNSELTVTLSGDHVATVSAPDENWNGDEVITFTATDPGGLSDSDPATFTVNNVNDAPVAVNDTAVTDEDIAVSVPVLSNDSDIDNDLLIIQTVTDPAHGTVVIQNDTLAVFTPELNWNGSDSFSYTTSDGNGGTATANVFLTVNAVDDAPVVSDIPDQTITEDEAFATVSLNDFVSDVDNADSSLTWSYSGNTILQISINANHVATIVPSDSNWNGSEVVTFSATDPAGLSDSDDATFTINGINDAPVVSTIPAQTIDEGQSFATISLDDYVADVDNADNEIVWSVSGNNNLQVAIDANRVATVSAPDSNWFGSENLTFTATDPGGLKDSSSAIFTVNAVNDAPHISGLNGQSVPEGSAFTPVALDDFVADVDNADSSLAWSVTGAVDLKATISNRVLTVDVPSAEWNGSETLLLTVTDPGSLTDSVQVVFEVTSVNDPTQFVAQPPALQFAEDDSLIYAVNNWYPFVEDVDNPDSTLIFTAYSGKMVQAVKKDANYRFIAPANWFGSDTLLLTASDGFYTDSAYFYVQVLSRNDAPEIVDLPAEISFDNDTTYVLNMKDFAKDIDTADSLLNWSFLTGIDSLLFNYNAATNDLTLSAAPGFSGKVLLFCTLTDDSSAEVTDTISVNITPPTGLEDNMNSLPKAYALHQNYPNPFNPMTNIKFDMPMSNKVTLTVFDVLGRKVAILVNAKKEAGVHLVKFDASHFSSGIYFYQIQAGKFVQIKKMILLK